MQAPTPPALPQVPVVAPAGATGPADVYQAFRAQRRELGRQLESLEQKRAELRGELQRSTSPADRTGIEARIKVNDERIASVEREIAVADASVARAAAIPGAVVDPPRIPDTGPPEEVFILGIIFMFVVMLPLTIAYARRIWRRGSTILSVPAELSDRFTRLEQAVDAIAVEVERIGEGQRYMTQAMARDGARALGAGAAEQVNVPRRDEIYVRRGEP